MASDESEKIIDQNEEQETSISEDTDKLTPDSVAQPADSDSKALPDHDADAPFFKEPKFWKNVKVVLGAVVIVGVIAGVAAVAGYYAGKTGSFEKTSDDTESIDTNDSSGSSHLKKTAEKIAGSSKNKRPHKDIAFTPAEIKSFCTENGLMISEGQTAEGFLAYNDTMKMIITVEENQGKSFDELVDQLIVSSAPLNSRAFEMSDNLLIYEGYLDKDQPQYGFCYLELLYGEKYYIFIQGLGQEPADAEIGQIRLIAYHLEEKLKMR